MSSNGVTTRYGVDITDLKANMQEANRQIKLVTSEFRNATAGMDDWSNSADGLSAKVSQLTSIEEQEQKKLDTLREEYNRVVQAQGEDSEGAKTLATEINNQSAKVKDVQSQLKDYTARLEDVSKTGVQKKIEELGEKFGNLGGTVQDLVSNGLSKLGEGLQNAGSYAVDLAKTGLETLKNKLVDVATNAVQLLTDKLGDFIQSSIETGKEFSSSMSEVGAISGASAEDLAELEATAREYGATTTFSASESAQALKYMALAGWKTTESTDALGGVLNLAAASGMDLASASDMVTDYLSAFSMEAGQAGDFADMLAYAQSNANTTAEGLGEAYKNCAANLNAAGQDVETTTSLLSMMANQGLKGSESGTALAAIMRDLTDKMSDGAVKIGDTSVAVMDAEGNYRDLTDILKDVEKATDGMGDAQKASALSSTFTSDSIKGLNLILNAGVDNAASFEKELRNCKDTASNMADTMNDNLEGDLKTLNSAIEEVELKLNDKLEPVLRKVVQWFTGIVTDVDWAGMLDKVTSFGETVYTTVKNVVQPAWETVSTAIGNAVNYVKENLPAIKETVGKTFETVKKKIADFQTKFDAFRGKVTTAIKTYIVPIFNQLRDSVSTIFEHLKTATQGTGDTFSEFGDKLKSVADTILPVVRDALIKIVEVVGNLIVWIIDNKDVVIAAITAIGAGLLAFNVVTTIQGVVTALSALPGILTVVQGAVAGVNAVISANPIGILIALIVALIAYFVHLYKSSEEFRDGCDIVWSDIKTFAGNIKDKAKEVWDFLEGFGAYMYDWLHDTVPNTLSNLVEKVKSFAKSIKDKIQAKWDFIKGFASYLYDWWHTTIPNNLNNLVSSVKSFFGKIKDKVNEVWDFFEGFGAYLYDWWHTTIPNKLNELLDSVRNFIGNVKNSVSDRMNEIKDSIADKFNSIKDNVVNFKDSVVSTIEELPDRIKSIGQNMVEGLWNGINDKFTWITDKITEFTNGILDGIKEFFGIESPSKLFKTEIGYNLVYGLANGITKKTKVAVASMTKLAKATVAPFDGLQVGVDTAKSTISSGASSNSNGVQSTGGTVMNFYQTNTSPKSLSRLEIYRQTKNQLNFAKGVA